MWDKLDDRKLRGGGNHSPEIIVFSLFYWLVFIMDMNYRGMPAPGRSLLSMMVLVYLVVGLVSTFTLLKHNYSSIAENRALENKSFSPFGRF